MSAAPLPEITLKQVAALFDAIAALANQVDRATFRTFVEGDAEQVEAALTQCRESVQRIGWMADLGCSKMGTYGVGQVRGGAEEWMLSSHLIEATAGDAR